MNGRFNGWDYFLIIVWSFSALVSLLTGISSILAHDGFTIIFLRFFVVFLCSDILFLTWCGSTQRIEHRAHEDQLRKKIKNLRSKIKEYEVGK
jgi:hypothetical protein